MSSGVRPGSDEITIRASAMSPRAYGPEAGAAEHLRAFAHLLHQAQLIEDAPATLGFGRRLTRLHCRTHALTEGLRVERLGHVVEDPLLPSPHLVVLARLGREQHDRDGSRRVIVLQPAED